MKFKFWLKEEESHEKQSHVFDFDDTIAVTKGSNVVMLFQDGEPAHSSVEGAIEWLKQNGVASDELLKGPKGSPFEYIPSRNGYAVYVNSSGLAKIQNNYRDHYTFTTDDTPVPKKGPNILIDPTPSFGVDDSTTTPIDQTINRIKSLNSKGADTMVLTARRSEGGGKDIRGRHLTPTNSKDIFDFMKKHGAAPTDGVVGTAGGQKGNELYKRVVSSKPEQEKPDEIHFYDDNPMNTSNVAQTLGGKIKQNLFLYGPGDFSKGHASAEKPNKVINSLKR
jgi:hypothetical protein